MSTLAAIEGQLCSGSRRHSRGFDISMTNDAVLIEIEKGVAAIRFNRPERLNALSLEVACGFADAIDSVLADSSVRVITVSGAGRAFLAGGDLAHFRGAADRGAAAAELIDPIHSALKNLLRRRQSPLRCCTALWSVPACPSRWGWTWPLLPIPR